MAVDPMNCPSPRYRAVSLWAVLSVVCGAASATMMFFGWLAAALPLAAIYFGLKALGQIDRLPEEYTGRRLAQVGIGLGAGLGILLERVADLRRQRSASRLPGTGLGRSRARSQQEE